MAERGGEERLADADRSEDERVAGLVDEPHRHELCPHRPVVGDGRGVVPRFEHHRRVELGDAGPPACGVAVASLHLVGEQLLEELGVGEVVLTGEREAFGEGVEQPTELQAAHQRS